MDNLKKYKDMQASVHEAIKQVMQLHGFTYQMNEEHKPQYGEGYIEAGPDDCVCRIDYTFSFSDLKDYSEP